MPDKIDFKATIVLKETKKFYNNNKSQSIKKDITIANICAPNNRVQKHMKQRLTEFKGRADNENSGQRL